MTKPTIELKACPFCGSKAILKDSASPWIRCVNDDCCAVIETYWKAKTIMTDEKQREWLASLWNRRSQ